MIPQRPRTFSHLNAWCHTYQTAGTVPQPRHIRYSIGVYQISQGLAWNIDAPVRWQSFCSAAMHWIMCGHAYGISLESAMPETLAEIDTEFPGWMEYMRLVGAAQQQIVYGLHESAVSTRASRFKVPVLEERLFRLVSATFALTPPSYREDGCFDEMNILTGDLPVKKG